MKKEDVNSLLSFYQERGRELPWRSDPTPYHVYLSEIMLQQTRVEAVKPYYFRFLSSFPNIASLSSASEEEVLKLWEGLGYYTRARNLHKASKIIQEKYGGIIPSEEKELCSLPGIGTYTSHAILSIAYQKPYIALDGNLFRIYARLTQEESPFEEKAKKRAEEFYLENIPSRAGDYNQALMDLGELVCLPNGAPLCEECPFSSSCLSHQNSCEQSYPKQLPKKEKKEVSLTVFLFIYQGEVILKKREEKGLLASLYEFPNIEQELSLDEVKSLLEKNNIPYSSIQKEKNKRHVFTHLIWNMSCYRIEVKKKFSSSFRKISTLASYPLPTAFLSYRTLLEKENDR